jgi:hypothetical protein
MRIEADDEVYRVNAVWLGPEQFQFPWRATYRAYGMGIVIFVVLLAIVRQLYGVTFWSAVFVLLFAIKLTQIINRRMGYERPFSSVLAMAVHEINAPRRSTQTRGLVAAAKAVLAESSEPQAVTSDSGQPAPKPRRFRLGRNPRKRHS